MALGRCNERAVFCRYPELGHFHLCTNVAIIDHCFGAMLLFAVFLSIYGSGTNDAFRLKAVTWCM